MDSSTPGSPRPPQEQTSELEIMIALTQKENNYYRRLQDKYKIVVEQCRTCWKIGKHPTQKCVHDKPLCPRCGSDESHAREACFVMCFRCGEIGSEAFHESCPRRRSEIVKLALMRKYNFDMKTARDVARGKLTLAEAR
ncbi:uncharacterized protein LOC100899947 isoform X2 [Galendromus occidentalis]|uniref:Uncharacterized protein LOC100899947 isoform X2 n=1 Tax=Galendromus occidentalis TaxID=34638 RepID=A0AAJ6VV94_9ACAR|nr:uncharacterized protein LOC100899947 isoform X2 [Galendromus occidentalis]